MLSLRVSMRLSVCLCPSVTSRGSSNLKRATTNEQIKIPSVGRPRLGHLEDSLVNLHCLNG